LILPPKWAKGEYLLPPCSPEATARLPDETELLEPVQIPAEHALCPRVRNGELVPQDPSAEPASVLLDRIRAERAATPVHTGRRRKSG